MDMFTVEVLNGTKVHAWPIQENLIIVVRSYNISVFCVEVQHGTKVDFSPIQ
jgi:hypothetical protein